MDESTDHIGRYKIIRPLGRGAMGVVYEATDPLIGRQVAIKTIRLIGSEGDEYRKELTRRLYREAQSAGTLTHPAIITIHDLGEHGDNAYIVMELVDGKSLETILASGVPQHSSTLFLILRKTAEALDYAHHKGIIHRDIKPSNIMICSDGTVRVADFGVAKLTAAASMTQSGLVLGTPSYMSPEQAKGQEIDGRSDQFSLAVVAYRLLTHKLPFEAPTLTALLAKILWEEPDYESAGLQAPVLSVFEKALAKDPQQRYSDCLEFVVRLEVEYNKSKKHVSSAVSKSVQSIPPTGSTASPAPKDTRSHHLEQKAKIKALPIVWSACVAVAVLAVVVFWALNHSPKPDSTDLIAPSAFEAKKKTEAPEPAKPPEQPAPEPVTPQSASAKEISVPGSQSLELEKNQPANTPIPKPKGVEASRKPTPPNSGTVVWSGEFPENSVLVISDGRPSFGKLTGAFPGKPVRIKVDPANIVIRVAPDRSNSWQTIMFYNKKEKFETIRILWEIID